MTRLDHAKLEALQKHYLVGPPPAKHKPRVRAYMPRDGMERVVAEPVIDPPRDLYERLYPQSERDELLRGERV